MPKGAITGYIDVAQLTLYAFWIFFAGLIFYLRREDRREGYPLESEVAGIGDRGFLLIPTPRASSRPGGTRLRPAGRGAPRRRRREDGALPGAPIEPVGDPMTAGVGPGSYALRADVPDVTFDGHTRIVPMRVDDHFSIEARDPDPRGMTVIGADREVAGVVADVWVDRPNSWPATTRWSWPRAGPPRAAAGQLRAGSTAQGQDQRPARSSPPSSPASRPASRADSVTRLRRSKVDGLLRRRHALRDPGPRGAAAVNAQDMSFVSGVPEPLPQGERLLWQGKPNWRSIARHTLHIDKIALYFAGLAVWQMTTPLWER